MIKIVADNKIPFLKGVLEPFAHVKYLGGVETDNSVVRDVDALITRTRTKCDSKTLSKSRVKIIATATIGFDHIATDYCSNNGIEWSNAPGCNAGSVKQYIASVLATIAVEKGVNLSNKTIGIVGVGNVGSKVKDLAQGLGMNVLLNDPPREEKEGENDFVDMETILAKCDFITFHVPLKKQGAYKTMHMGNKAFFLKCKKDVVIINSSRGEVINNDELVYALDHEIVGNAVIDVWENEPHINLALLKSVFVATPHVAGYSVDGKANGTAKSVQSISKYFNFPLKNWYPENLPKPKEPIVNIDAKDMTFQDICVKAIHHTYRVLEDDNKLRSTPESFEQQRGSYPFRREFGAYKLIIKNGSDEFVEMLNKIGFIHVQLI